MFHQFNGVRALFVLCLFKIIACDGSFHLFYEIPATEYDGCENLSRFFQTIYTSSPVNALKTIISPLACSTCPQKSHFLHQNLIKLVSHGSLNINFIIANLKKVKNLNRYDVLITTLMAINEFTKVDPKLKLEISNEIFYLLKRRYLKINNYSNLRQGFCQDEIDVKTPFNSIFSRQIPHPFSSQIQRANIFPSIQTPVLIQTPINYYPKPQSTPYLSQPLVNYGSPIVQHAISKGFPSNHANGCSCQTKIIEMLLDRLVALERQRKQQSSCNCNQLCRNTQTRILPSKTPILPNSLQFRNSPQNLGLKSPNVPKKPVNNLNLLHDLLKNFPISKYPKEKMMYQKFKALLQNPQIQNLVKNMDLSKYKPSEILYIIITTVLHTIKTEEIQEVFAFFKTYREAARTGFNFGNLLDFLPPPKNLKEQNYHNITKHLLLSKGLYNLKLSPNFQQATNLSDKLIILIQELLKTNTISGEIREALQYYLPVLVGKRANIHFENLIPLLPTPVNDVEKRQLDVLKNLLASNELYVLMKNYNLNHLTPAQLLQMVLHHLVNHHSEYSDAALYSRNKLAVEKYGFNYYDLLNLIPVTQENRPFIQLLNNYFHSPEFEAILANPNLKTLSNIDKLLLILETIQNTSTDANILKAVANVLDDVRLQVFYQNMQQKIINLIPAPKNNIEKRQYETVKSFLLSKRAYLMLAAIDLSVFPDNKHLLEFVFKTVTDSNLEENIRDAFEYYLDIAHKLKPLEFVTKKEIKKKFKLTEIFTDTLDLRTLTVPQKRAFKNFFKYISEFKPDAMSKFDSWDQAKTRGEFMKLLFKYFLDSSTVLPEIKESIKILNPLVKMDGKGALPP
ncbi:uncharacterized protein LOC123013295 [Tribolium madens]|uniref:uncharacterized protein LOC123013295 n=1 Tax=Tribolium madens TaxID=41895 RepID=UPI001CF74F95|nr:uncharacterized protein LOC123013295 [Tribolium madens]